MKKEDNNCGEFGEYPSVKWTKFFETFKEIETLSADKWKPVHLIAYFCKKYKAAYDVNYQFKFNSVSPVKSFEVFQVKKLSMLLSSDPVILQQYIDWVYEIKVVKGKRRLTSISFMTHDELVNDYKFNVLLGKKKQLQIDRSSPLPADIREIFKDVDYVKTYGDLVFVFRAIEGNSDNSQVSPVLMSAIEKLKLSNFDFSNLDRIV